MTDALAIFIIAIAVAAIVFSVWLLALLRDGRKLRREADEWRRDIARQREIHGDADEDTTLTLPNLPGDGSCS